MSGFIKRNTSSTLSVNPARLSYSQPNAGQFGWIAEENTFLQKILEYVEMCKTFAEQSGAYAKYVEEKYPVFNQNVRYIDEIYTIMKPMLEPIKFLNSVYPEMVRMYEQVSADTIDARFSKDQARASADEAAYYAELLKNVKNYGGVWKIEEEGRYPNVPVLNTEWDIVTTSESFNFDGEGWSTGDKLLCIITVDDQGHSSSKFQRVPKVEAGVTSVNGRKGDITLQGPDIGSPSLAAKWASDMTPSGLIGNDEFPHGEFYFHAPTAISNGWPILDEKGQYSLEKISSWFTYLRLTNLETGGMLLYTHVRDKNYYNWVPISMGWFGQKGVISFDETKWDRYSVSRNLVNRDGRVSISGTFRSKIYSGSTVPLGTLIAKVPVGFRPLTEISSKYTDYAGTVHEVRINPNGDIVCNKPNGWYQVTFSTEYFESDYAEGYFNKIKI